jgi:hypothetical protein
MFQCDGGNFGHQHRKGYHKNKSQNRKHELTVQTWERNEKTISKKELMVHDQQAADIFMVSPTSGSASVKLLLVFG